MLSASSRSRWVSRAHRRLSMPPTPQRSSRPAGEVHSPQCRDSARRKARSATASPAQPSKARDRPWGAATFEADAGDCRARSLIAAVCRLAATGRRVASAEAQAAQRRQAGHQGELSAKLDADLRATDANKDGKADRGRDRRRAGQSAERQPKADGQAPRRGVRQARHQQGRPIEPRRIRRRRADCRTQAARRQPILEPVRRQQGRQDQRSTNSAPRRWPISTSSTPTRTAR